MRRVNKEKAVFCCAENADSVQITSQSEIKKTTPAAEKATGVLLFVTVKKLNSKGAAFTRLGIHTNGAAGFFDNGF